MSLERGHCSECGTNEYHCPACGSEFVTPRDGCPNFIEEIDTGDSETLSFTHVCWDCGWYEDVTLHIEREVGG